MRLHRYRLCSLAVLTALLISFTAVFTSHAKTVEETIFDYLINKMGFNSAAACGILANIEKESSFNPTVYGDNDTSYGLCQWHGVRFTNLRRYCDEHSLDYTTVEGQLEFLNYELSSLPKIVKYMRSVADTADGAYDAAYYWCYNFEIPANREQNSILRGELARTKYWPIFGNSGIPADEGPYETWKVTETKVNVRTGPGTTYPVATIWTKDSEVHITEISVLDSGEIWGKTRLGWSDMSYMTYVSGALYTVNYRTGCASVIPDVPVRFGEEHVLVSSDELMRHGYTFVGWSVGGGETLAPGERVMIKGNITVSGIWERNPDVTLIRGDANCDTGINARDISIIMKYLVGTEVPISLPCADADMNGKINARDISLLMKVIMGSASVEPTVSAEDEASWAS